jgi:hypothetical protein
VSVRFVDELDGAFGWLETTGLRRTSHALAAAGRVWLVDPFEAEGVEERVRALGEPGGVIQLLDRHNRASVEYAERLGVPLHVVPDALPGSPFRFVPILRRRWWDEVALWWPEPRILVCADALGTVPDYFRAGDEGVGVHPFLRLLPPRRLVGLEPLHLLVGHGEGLHGEATARAVDAAVRQARRRIPRWLAGVPRLRHLR